MFRLATNGDLIRLKSQFRDKWFVEEDVNILRLRDPFFEFTNDFYWCLKQLGCLFCYEQILNSGAEKVLEVGAGFNLYFERVLSRNIEYVILDKPGFYRADLFEAANKRRQRSTFVDGLLGDILPILPPESFDVTFSVSVLEHVTEKDIPGVCQDMFRITKPGGIAVHTIDVSPQRTQTLGMLYYQHLLEAGFEIAEQPQVSWDYFLPSEKQILLEPYSQAFTYYSGVRADMWENIKMVGHNTGTILVKAVKPA